MRENVLILLMLLAFLSDDARAEEMTTKPSASVSARPNRWLHEVRNQRILDSIAAYYTNPKTQRARHVGFHYGDTVAVVYSKKPISDYRPTNVLDLVNGCQLMKVKGEEYKNDVLAYLDKFMEVRSLPAGLMVQLNYRCQRVGRSKRSTSDRFMVRNGFILSEIAANYSAAESPESFRANHAAFYAKETVVVLHSNQGRMDDCRLMNVDGKDRMKEVLTNLTEYLPVIEFPVEEMVHLIRRCQEVGQSSVTAGSPTKELSKIFTNLIVPGTKWCGKGDLAEFYDDLGSASGTDKCCRAHDHCPISIGPMRSNHNLFNFSLKPRLLCICEEELYKCLEWENSIASKYASKAYFNFFQSPECIIQDPSSGDLKYFKSDLYGITK